MVIPREVPNSRDPVETTRRPLSKYYLLGALHDATERKTTYRIGTNSRAYAQILKKGIISLGYKAWIYREGKTRTYYIVEFSKNILLNIVIQTFTEKADYIRGYFDTDGGVSRSRRVRFYLYFAQKNKSDLEQVKAYLEELGILCGVIHNPSKLKDAEYWRFFIRAASYELFRKHIGSSHPRKSVYLRVKI